MRLLPLTPAAGVVAPHAPVLLAELGGERTAQAGARIRAALRAVDLHGVDVVVILSPHGSTTGVYRRVRGGLDGFGVAGVTIERHTDPLLARSLADRWDAPLVDDDADHGIVVPLLLQPLPDDIAVVAAAIREQDADAAVAGEAFAGALATAPADAVIAFVASMNTSAALASAGPLGYRDAAVKWEADLLSALGRDAGLAAEAAATARAAGSCAAGPLRAFAALFGGRPAEVLAHEHPAGVGYVVACA